MKWIALLALTMLGCAGQSFLVFPGDEETTTDETATDTSGDDGLPPGLDSADAIETAAFDSGIEGGADTTPETRSDAASSDTHDGADAKDTSLKDAPAEACGVPGDACTTAGDCCSGECDLFSPSPVCS